MVHRGQVPSCPEASSNARFRLTLKKKEQTLLSGIDDILSDSSDAWVQERSGRRVREHVLAQLIGLGRHTVTGVLNTCGRSFEDWTADYRLYSQERVEPLKIFGTVRQGVEHSLADDDPLIVGMDDSVIRKCGTKIPGVAWRRDPLGPPFSTNFVRGQRFVQLSAALPLSQDGAARMLPINFVHAPTAVRPKKNAPESDWAAYRIEQKQRNINKIGSQCLGELIRPDSSRDIWAVVDGRFTNGTILKSLPDALTLIGRIRGDAKLYRLPSEETVASVGRRKRYGERIPTPEEIRTDDKIPWQHVQAFAAGKTHEFRIKTISPLRWRTAGDDTDLRLIVIAPLGYRLRKGGKLLYRKPAFLICVDPAIPVEKVLQAYIWRWEVEVNFRDEKSLLGIGEAQVRNESSVQTAPALGVAAYSVLLLAAAKTYGPAGIPDTLPPNSWRRNEKPRRATTMNLIQQLRYELWSKGMHMTNFSGFSARFSSTQKPEKFNFPLENALFYAQTS